MISRWLSTSDDRALFILRVTVGVVVFAHGLQKAFGLFGGHGALETMEMFEKWFGMPAFLTLLVIMSDSIGAFCVVIGFFTRFMAISISFVMLGAMYLVHGKWGFYMNWYTAPNRGEGFEFHLLILAICIVLTIKGAGAWSIDRWISSRKNTVLKSEFNHE